MTIDLREQLFPIERVLDGTDNFDLTDGRLKILAGDTEILNEKVPNNKKWRISVSVKIEESNL